MGRPLKTLRLVSATGIGDAVAIPRLGRRGPSYILPGPPIRIASAHDFAILLLRATAERLAPGVH